MEKFKSILLVDDDEATNFLHSLLLTEWGVVDSIYTASNGQEALDFLKNSPQLNREPPTLILLDINMPVMDGFEFLEVYADLDPSLKASIVVFMLTTSLHKMDRERARRFRDISSYLSKPLEKDQLLEMISRISIEDFQ